jgi:hypothetical protein
MRAQFRASIQKNIAAAWFPIVLGVFTIAAFSVVGLAAGQVQEVLSGYLTNRDDPYRDFAWGRVAITFFAIFLFATTLLQSAARLMDVDLRPPRALQATPTDKAVLLALGWFMPWIAIALSFFDAGRGAIVAYSAADPEYSSSWSAILFGTPFPTLAVLALVMPVALLLVWRSPPGRALRGAVFGSRFWNGAVQATVPTLFIAMTLYFLVLSADNLRAATYMGPIAIVAISLAGVAAAGTFIIKCGRARAFPFLACLMLLPLAWGGLRLDDNHQIRRLSDEVSVDRPTLRQAMDRFLENSAPDDPIILVSTEGGGIRAAHFTAVVLARLADLCPALGRRVFLISSVSGGSIGASAYYADASERPVSGEECRLDVDTVGPRQTALSEMFTRDFLSATVGKQAFPELLQIFLPASAPNAPRGFVPLTDRQLGLELSVEQAFARTHPSPEGAANPMERSFFAPASAPHLLINLTRVDNGADYVASTLDLLDVQTVAPHVYDFVSLWQQREYVDGVPKFVRAPDFRLSTIATTSARFPVVSPAGSVVVDPRSDCAGAVCRFVDGGYFDNSGIETLLGAIQVMRSWPDWRQLRSRIVVLHIDSNPAPTTREDRWRPDFDIHELEAVLATREQRVQMSYNSLNTLVTSRDVCRWSRLTLVQSPSVSLRLGWVLSPLAADDIERQAAEALRTLVTGRNEFVADCNANPGVSALRM